MHRYENPFMNIPSYADKFFGMFSEEDDIVVQEKIDGSNSHIRVTKDGVTCYGNNYILNEILFWLSGSFFLFGQIFIDLIWRLFIWANFTFVCDQGFVYLGEL